MSEKSAKLYRSRLPRVYRKEGDCRFGEMIPVLNRFVLPGDIWRINSACLLRYMPMAAPPLNNAHALFRFFFVPLRLVEPNFEKVITGSADGRIISESDIPSLAKFFDANTRNKLEITKYSIGDYLSFPVGVYKDTSNNIDMTRLKTTPSMYWFKAYSRIYWDWYRDENLLTGYTDYNNFQTVYAGYLGTSHSTAVSDDGVFFSNGNKDYFMSALPWQLKGPTPTITIDEVQGNLDFSSAFTGTTLSAGYAPLQVGSSGTVPGGMSFSVGASSGDVTYDNSDFQDLLESGEFSIPSVSFNASQFRDMFAQTRVYEQLARTGSRYVEYLKGFFGTSPRDETLQRSVYLGGYKQNIITSEVIQTAGAVNSSSEQLPVGTLRGHGISNGQGRISFVAKEYGMIFGIMCVRPDQIYSQGVDKEYTYTDRFDFFNPAFQHLSEQEVRKGEIYFGSDKNTDGSYINDDVFGFQPYAEELRRGRNQVVGDLRDGLGYWSQSINFSSRPSLNQAFISTKSHLASFNKPFVVNSTSARPILFRYQADCEVFRPMVKEGIPGLIDHI